MMTEPSPMDRDKAGMQRLVVVDKHGTPFGVKTSQMKKVRVVWANYRQSLISSNIAFI